MLPIPFDHSLYLKKLFYSSYPEGNTLSGMKRTICTSVSQRDSTKMCRHSSPFFGSRYVCSYSGCGVCVCVCVLVFCWCFVGVFGRVCWCAFVVYGCVCVVVVSQDHGIQKPNMYMSASLLLLIFS